MSEGLVKSAEEAEGNVTIVVTAQDAHLRGPILEQDEYTRRVLTAARIVIAAGRLSGIAIDPAVPPPLPQFEAVAAAIERICEERGV